MLNNLKNAFIALEDKRFYEHEGFDTYRMMGAMAKNIARGGVVEGASTITQQLIKNTHLTFEKTMSRKLKEIALAQRLEDMYSKDEKIIGSWINGKPLYQKTFATKVPKVNTQIALNLSDMNVENIISFISSFSNNEIINMAPNTSSDNYLNFWYNKNAKLLHISCTEENWQEWDLYITIQYTKTSDKENSFNDEFLNYVEGPSTIITYYNSEDVTNAVNALW